MTIQLLLWRKWSEPELTKDHFIWMRHSESVGVDKLIKPVAVLVSCLTGVRLWNEFSSDDPSHNSPAAPAPPAPLSLPPWPRHHHQGWGEAEQPPVPPHSTNWEGGAEAGWGISSSSSHHLHSTSLSINISTIRTSYIPTTSNFIPTSISQQHQLHYSIQETQTEIQTKQEFLTK